MNEWMDEWMIDKIDKRQNIKYLIGQNNVGQKWSFAGDENHVQKQNSKICFFIA